MRNSTATLLVLLGFGLAGCARHDNRPPAQQYHEDHNAAAREAGRAAYKLKEESKVFAKKAGHELRIAGREMHEGWKEAKQQDRERKGK